MGFYQWRLRISLAAAQQSLHLAPDQQRHRSQARAMRLRRVLCGLVASAASLPGVQRCRTTSLVALAFAVLICASPAGLADTLDVPGQFAILGVGSAPCTSLVRAVGQTAQAREMDRQAMLAWVQGYLSFYNSVSEGTYDVTGGADAAALQASLLDFASNILKHL
jgi:hypothetical protein